MPHGESHGPSRCNPMNTGLDWSIRDTEEAIAVGPHVSTMIPEVMVQLQNEIEEKLQEGQAQVVL